MTARTAADRDQLREQARKLIAEDLSNREIARRLGVGKDTVRRWRTTDRAAAHAGAPANTPPATRDAPPRRPARATPPPGARHLTLDIDDDLAEDLDVLVAAGLDPATAVACAIQLLADAYRAAWDYGDAPRGTVPRICAHAVGARTLHCTPAAARRPTNESPRP